MKLKLFRVLDVIIYPFNGIMLISYIVLSIAGVDVGAALALAAIPGAVYERACRRHGRRVWWPFNTPGARVFEQACELRAKIAVRDEELQQLRASNDRLEARNEFLAAYLQRVRDGEPVDTDHTLFGVRVTRAEHRSDHISVDFTATGDHIVDIHHDGDRKRYKFPHNEPTVYRDVECVADADVAIILDDLRDRDGTLWVSRRGGEHTRLEFTTDDGRVLRRRYD